MTIESLFQHIHSFSGFTSNESVFFSGSTDISKIRGNQTAMANWRVESWVDGTLEEGEIMGGLLPYIFLHF